jgi:hypothetical protein
MKQKQTEQEEKYRIEVQAVEGEEMDEEERTRRAEALRDIYIDGSYPNFNWPEPFFFSKFTKL